MAKELYPLTGVISTVISPFIGDDKKLDLKSLANEIDMACKAGVAGFLVPCDASEQKLLSNEEKRQLVEVTAKTAAGRAKLITSLAADSAEEDVKLLHEYVSYGIDGVNIKAPYENDDQFLRIVEAVDAQHPQFVFIQDADITGDGLRPDLLVRCFNEFESVVGAKVEVKYSAPKCSKLVEMTDGKMLLASAWGNDQLLEMLDRGIKTIMPSGLFELFVNVLKRYEQGNREGAKQLFFDMLPIIEFTRQSQELNRWFHKRYLREFGAFETELSRETVVLDKYHYAYADELIARAKELIAAL